MDLPFTVEQFLSVFERYNRAIGPAPLLAYALGIAALVLACRGGRRSGRAVLGILALFWVFDGAAYHLAFFRQVNPAAVVFGGLFLLQGAIFALAAARAEPLPFRLHPGPRGVLALALAAYALVAYPLLGAAAGHVYPRAPVFGVAPCPTTIFTFALLLLAEGAVPARLLVLPLLWSILGVSAAAQLGIREDYGLAVAGVAGTAVLVAAGRRRPALGPP
jgi:Family of unknown function (DUF6064)